jgi:hypothetical protein
MFKIIDYKLSENTTYIPIYIASCWIYIGICFRCTDPETLSTTHVASVYLKLPLTASFLTLV